MVNGSEFLRLNGEESGEKNHASHFISFWSIVALFAVCFWKKKLLHVARTQKQRLRWIGRKGERKADRGVEWHTLHTIQLF